MKKVAVLLVMVFVVSSCSLFKKPSMTQEEINAMVAQKAVSDEQVINLQHELDLMKIKLEECSKQLEEKVKPETVSGKYFVIAGSFKNSAFANEFAAKVKQKGGSGTILQGPYNFNLVVYSSHSSLREAATSMYLARTNISDDAWVYMTR